MDTEWKWNGYRTVTSHKNGKKSVLQNANCKRTRSSEHMLVSYAIRLLTEDVTLNTRSSNFCLPGDLKKMTGRIILCLFLFLFTRTKQASSLHLPVHFMFIAAILLLTTSSTYVQIRKWMDESS